MIAGIVKHGRTKRDSRNLSTHLSIDAPKTEMINTLAPDLDSAMNQMERARDSSRADAAFYHIHLSPSTEMSREDLRKSAAVVMDYFDASDHTAAVIYHQKNRVGGDGDQHAHIVLGRVGPDGKCMPAQFEKIKLEACCRLLEFEFGEPPLLGRHHKNSVKQMQKMGRNDVANWLVNAHGLDPDKPRSAIAASKREMLSRHSIEFSEIRDQIRSAWEKSDGKAGLENALNEQGLTLAEGDKKGVWIVSKNGVDVGALDRLTGQKRKVVALKMELKTEATPEKIRSVADKNTASKTMRTLKHHRCDWQKLERLAVTAEKTPQAILKEAEEQKTKIIDRQLSTERARQQGLVIGKFKPSAELHLLQKNLKNEQKNLLKIGIYQADGWLQALDEHMQTRRPLIFGRKGWDEKKARLQKPLQNLDKSHDQHEKNILSVGDLHNVERAVYDSKKTISKKADGALKLLDRIDELRANKSDLRTKQPRELMKFLRESDKQALKKARQQKDAQIKADKEALRREQIQAQQRAEKAAQEQRKKDAQNPDKPTPEAPPRRRPRMRR